MSERDDDRFRPRVGPPKARGQGNAPRFITRVLKETSRAGKTIGRQLRPPRLRVGAKFGRGHVAARLAGRGLGPRARRAVVKTRLVILKDASPRSTEKHLRYIERDGVTREGGPGRLYDATTDEANGQSFTTRGEGDRHQFRFIVSPEDAVELEDLRHFTRQLMSQMERDLGTRLEWVACDHWDTDNPHTHIVLRGVDETGRDLVIARDYIAHGMRARVAELATEWLGPRTDLEIRASLKREIEQERWTSLDRSLQQQAQSSTVTLWHEPHDVEGRFRQACLIGRLDYLTKMGLATNVEPGIWTLSTDLESTLRAMGERGDIIRTMQRAFGAQTREYRIFDRSDARAHIIGRVAGAGLADELTERSYLLVDGLDGRAYYVPLPERADLADFTQGAVIEVTNGGEARPADHAIVRVADQGIYRSDSHLQLAQAQLRDGTDPQAYVQAHVRRLESLRRAGIVERLDEGVWRLPPDFMARAQQYEQRRSRGARVEIRSRLSIERQIRTIGATWLDQQLVTGSRVAAVSHGFGAEVQTALVQRANFLIEQGFAQRRGQRVVFVQNLLSTLRAREIEAAAQRIEAETGLHHRPVANGQRIRGTYRRSIDLASGRFAMLDDATGFSLVPWRPVIEKRVGQSLSAVIQDGRVSWEFGRDRGRSI